MGVLTVSGDLKTGSSVTGGAGNDVFTAGRNTVTYRGGSGNDQLSSTASQLSGGTKFEGGGGTDTLNISDTGAVNLQDSHFANISGVEKITINTINTMALFASTNFNNSFSNGATITHDIGAGTMSYTNLDFSNVTVDVTVNITAGDGTVYATAGKGSDTITISMNTDNSGDGLFYVWGKGGDGDDTISINHGTQEKIVSNFSSAHRRRER